MVKLPIKLKVAIMDSDTITANALKTVIKMKPDIEEVEIFDSFERIDRAFKYQGFKGLFIDIFSIGVAEGTEIIGHIREIYPISSVCLYSSSIDLKEMPNVDDYWRNRFQHYFKLRKDQNKPELEETVEDSLCALSSHIAAVLDRSKRFDEQRKQKIENSATIEERGEETPYVSLSNFLGTPKLNTEKIESFTTETLNYFSKSISIYTKIVIGVFVIFSTLVIVSLILACIRNEWEAIALAGLGMAGILTWLFINPLKFLTASFSRILIIQLSYLDFLKQFKLLDSQTDSISVIERSKRLEEIAFKTVQIINGNIKK